MLSCVVDVIFLQRQIAPAESRVCPQSRGWQVGQAEPDNKVPQSVRRSLTYQTGETSVAKTATKTGNKRSTKSMKKSMSTRQGKCNDAADESANLPAGEDGVTIDRRRAADRRGHEAEFCETTETTDATAAPKLERRKKVNRRRQIDPTTCERDYTEQEVEFMNALDDYKRKSGRMFPTCSEVLEVIHSLGYVKLSASQLAVQANGSTASAKPMLGDLQAAASDIVFEAVGEQLG
jgi:hypothetical protein